MNTLVRSKSRNEPRRVRLPYCLACYAPIERSTRTSVTCPRCEFVNLAADQRRYWTLEPKLKETEWLAKVATGLVVGLVVFLMMRRIGIRFGLAQGYAVGFPIVIGWVLWETAGKITQKKPYFRATLFWMALPGIVALPFVLATVWPGDMTAKERLISILVATVIGSLALIPYLVGKSTVRWQEKRILAGQEDAQASISRPLPS